MLDCHVSQQLHYLVFNCTSCVTHGDCKQGSWETAQTNDDLLRNEWDWFRIGWQPVFVDYTKRGTWFVMVLFCEWTLLACVGILLDDSMTQLFLYGLIRLLLLGVLLWLRPYANRYIHVNC